jgi:Ca-activated chloride channel homolog
MLQPSRARNGSVPYFCACRPILSVQLVVLLLAGCLLTVSAVAGAPQESGQEDVLRVRTDLVTVPAVVVDSKGRRLFGLKQDDFAVQVDGRPINLNHFSTGTDHVALAFLLDASGSARDYLTRQREAAFALFSRFGPNSEIAVIRFAEKAELAVPFTNELAKAQSGFEFPAVVGRHTAIFDAAESTIHLFAQRKTDPTERRIIILTSDGLDTASIAKAAEVIRSAQTAGVSFYVILFPLFVPTEGHLTVRQTSKGFRDLADKTGGRYFVAGDVKSVLDPNAHYDLAAVFKSIEEDLASQYLLGFYPDESMRDNRSHHIEVALAKKTRGFRVDTMRKEYNLNRDH